MSEENVIPFKPGPIGDGITLPTDDVLNHAVGKLQSVCVIGLTGEGQLYVAGSHGGVDSVFLMERAKLMIVQNEVVR